VIVMEHLDRMSDEERLDVSEEGVERLERPMPLHRSIMDQVGLARRSWSRIFPGAVYGLGALSADREGWVAQARRTSAGGLTLEWIPTFTLAA
jgi:hypothetical protein